MSIIGKTFNQRFHILKPLAQGGFGHTYLAEDLTFNSRQKCVVKHLSPSKENLPHLARIKELFEREADALAKLSLYSNLIPKLIDRFEESGELYLVQEFIDGVPLSAELTPGKRFTEEATIELLLQILIPLDYCHRENLLHRDLKPANIMRRHQTGELVLIDFGLAKDMGASITHESYGGTPGYAPEEQQYGFPVLASDVYAVGMIAIQALTGMSPAEFQRNRQTMELEWPKHNVDKFSFANALCRMVHPSADSRYQNAQEALAAIQSIQLFDCAKGDWRKPTSQVLVKSNVKGKKPTQMFKDWMEFNEFYKTAPTEDQIAQNSKRLGLIDGEPFTFVLHLVVSEYSGSLREAVTTIDLHSIEYKYQETQQTLRKLAPKISDVYFPNSNNICMYSDWKKGFIPLTTIRLARLKDMCKSLKYFEKMAKIFSYGIYEKQIQQIRSSERCHDQSFNYFDEYIPILVEMFTSLDSCTIGKIIHAISELTRSCDSINISYLLETVFSDAGQNDFYLFSYTGAMPDHYLSY